MNLDKIMQERIDMLEARLLTERQKGKEDAIEAAGSMSARILKPIIEILMESGMDGATANNVGHKIALTFYYAVKDYEVSPLVFLKD